MIGDRRITLLAFFAATLLHLVLFVLASYMPIPKWERPTPPSRTRYVVQFQQPVPTATPTAIPGSSTPMPPITPVLPEPETPVPRQPAPAPQPVPITQQPPQPTAMELQRPEPLPKPVEMQVRPRQPTPSQEPAQLTPHPERPTVPNVARPNPVDQVKRPKRVEARKPADVKVHEAKQTAPLKPSTPKQLTLPRESEVSRLPTSQKPVPPIESALPPSQPAPPPAQDLQRQYLSMVSEALQRHKRYPRVARRRGLSGKVVLDFVILPDGQITQARIVTSQSTHHGILNEAALRALQQASPLPPFPKALQKPSLRVTLPILYELTER